MGRPAACWLTMCAMAVLGQSAAWAEMSGGEVLKKALALREGVQDYVVEVHMHVELEGATIPDKTATVYFKRPGKLHVESPEGVVILPKEAFLMGRLTEQIEENAQIALVGSKPAAQGPVYHLKITPKDKQETGRLLVSVNGWNWTVQQMQVWEGGKLALTINWEHRLVDGKFWMPAKVSCELAGLGAGREASRDPDEGFHRPSSPLRGKATFSLRNYRINRGLKDEVFQQE